MAELKTGDRALVLGEPCVLVRNNGSLPIHGCNDCPDYQTQPYVRCGMSCGVGFVWLREEAYVIAKLEQ